MESWHTGFNRQNDKEKKIKLKVSILFRRITHKSARDETARGRDEYVPEKDFDSVHRRNHRDDTD